MAGGPVAVAAVAGDRAKLYHNTLTCTAFLYCMLISWAGALFGLDLDRSLLPVLWLAALHAMQAPQQEGTYHECICLCRQKQINDERLCAATHALPSLKPIQGVVAEQPETYSLCLHSVLSASQHITSLLRAEQSSLLQQQSR